MTSLQHLENQDPAPDSPRFRASRKKMVYLVCMFLFAIGTISRLALDRYWRSVSPHVIDGVGGHTYALAGGGAAVFVTPIQGHALQLLMILPLGFLVLGMLVWARSWREWS